MSKDTLLAKKVAKKIASEKRKHSLVGRLKRKNVEITRDEVLSEGYGPEAEYFNPQVLRNYIEYDIEVRTPEQPVQIKVETEPKKRRSGSKKGRNAKLSCI